MNEQLSFFPDDVSNIVSAFSAAANEVFEANGLTGLSVEIKRNKDRKYVVKLFSLVLCSIADFKKPYIMFFDMPQFGQSSDKIYLGRLADACNYAYKLQSVIQTMLDAQPKEFSCCSRYLQCSDACSCVHPDKYFALGCYYRKVLASGNVYYGTNRNVN